MFLCTTCDSEVSATPRHRAAVPLDGDTEQVCSSTHLISHLSPTRHELCIADYPQWASALCVTLTLPGSCPSLSKSLPLNFLFPLHNSAISALFYPLSLLLSLSLSVSVSVSVWLEPRWYEFSHGSLCWHVLLSRLHFDFISQKFVFSQPVEVETTALPTLSYCRNNLT